MQKEFLKEITIKLPSDVADTVSIKEIITLLIDKCLNKLEYYKTKCQKFQEKYGMDFLSFKKKVEQSKKEIFTEWDDLLLWEGYELAYKEWEKKYKELKSVNPTC